MQSLHRLAEPPADCLGGGGNCETRKHYRPSLGLVSPEEVLSCENRDVLKARMRADLKVYGDAVRALQSSLGPDFKTAHQRVEQARLAFEAASQALLSHIASHGCG